MDEKKILVAFSGGQQSAVSAIEVHEKYKKLYGTDFCKENIILLNHDISSKVEHESIKKFKKEVSSYLGIPITYANADNFEERTPLKVVKSLGIIQTRPGQAFCTSILKTRPFYKYLETYCKDRENYKIVYGFTEDEPERISRRRTYLMSMGYDTEFPLAEGHRTIWNISDVGIKKPIVYRIFQHANCIGCLKANSKAHWYCVFCLRPDIFEEAMLTEEMQNHSIIRDVFLKDMVPYYEKLQAMGICPSDKGDNQSFWADVKKHLPDQPSFVPCDCML